MSDNFLVKNLIISEVSSEGRNRNTIYLRLKDNGFGHLVEIDRDGVYSFRRIGGLTGNLKLDRYGRLIEKEGEYYE